MWARLGRVLFYITWPGIYLVIRFSPPRTRVVIVANGKVLLLKSWLGDGDWTLPGGGLHRGEDPVAGALREVHEETGILLSAKDLHKSGVLRVRSKGIPTDCITFWVKLPEQPGVVLQKLELVAYRWIPLSEQGQVSLSTTAKAALAAFSKA